MDDTATKVCGPRSGVALILVIGMLALIMIMGVSFSIFMRTERAAAGNYRNDVQARQLLQVALARAIEDLESNIGANPYPPWAVFQSRGTVTNDDALAGTIASWVPQAVLEGTNVAPQWQALDGLGSGGALNGRVSYLVLNCSGLLDANYACGSPRWVGTNAAEIATSGLEVTDMATLVAGRPFPHMQALNSYAGARGGLSGSSQHFVTYSAVPTNGLLDISGDAATLVARRNEIIAILSRPEFMLSALQARMVFTNLIDYVDGDCIPGNLNGTTPANPEGPSVEPVWMFNEVKLSTALSFTPSGSDGKVVAGSRVVPQCECIFPFIAGDNTGFKLNVSFFFKNCSPSLCPTPNPTVVQSVPINPSPGNYYSVQNLFPISIPAGGIVSPGQNVTVEVRAWVTKVGAVVDSVTNTPVSLSFGVDIAGTATNVDRECADPRLNGNLAYWNAPRTGGPVQTIGSENTQASWYNGTINPPAPLWQTRDGDTAMFVANRALQTVGEMGYLFFGQPWETLRLYKHGYGVFPNNGKTHPVTDFFTVGLPPAPAFRGKVNVNTQNSGVLKAVFQNMPVDSPSGAGASLLTDPELTAVTDGIMARTAVTPMTRLSELGLLDWKTLAPALTRDVDRESLIRNTADLLTTRQQYFIVLVYAQTTKVVPNVSDRSIVSGLRGVAELWRDSSSAGAGRLRFMRSFQIIQN